MDLMACTLSLRMGWFKIPKAWVIIGRGNAIVAIEIEGKKELQACRQTHKNYVTQRIGKLVWWAAFSSKESSLCINSSTKLLISELPSRIASTKIQGKRMLSISNFKWGALIASEWGASKCGPHTLEWCGWQPPLSIWTSSEEEKDSPSAEISVLWLTQGKKAWVGYRKPQ